MALLYLSVINTITDSKKLMRSITICIVTATLFSIYGLLSYILIKLGHASIVKSLGYFIGNSPAAATFGDRGVRIQALFPEPLIFGSYLLTIIPVTIGCLFTKTKYPKFLILSAFFILLLTAIFTFSRGCWLGLLFCFLILAVIFWPKLTAKQIKIIFLGIFIFLCLFLMARFKYIQKDLVKIKRLTIEQVTALKNINYYIDLNKQINSGDKNKIEKIPGLEWSTIMRVNDIVAGIAMAKSHPFFGVGWGNYIFNYLEYDPRFMSWWWMDMPNSDNRPGTPICPNLFVSVLAETGFIGLIAFLAFLGSVFWVFILAIRKKFNNGLIFLVSGYFAAFCAVIITYQFYSTLYFAFFWIMLGMGIAAVNISLTSSKQ